MSDCPQCGHGVGQHGMYGCFVDDACGCPLKPEQIGQPAPSRRPLRAGAPAFVAPGGVLASYDAYACTQCGGRRYEAFSCCDRAAIPVTVTLTRREVAP